LAKWLVLTGHTVGAAEALAIGLIDAVERYERLDSAIADIIGSGRVQRGQRDTTPQHAAVEQFFESNDVDTIRAGAARTGGDPQLDKAVKRIASKAPLALRIAADLIDRGAGLPIDEALQLELGHLEQIFATKDAYEGLSSLGKKPPVFRGA
jgi:enoyl-CoA hydratase/carnithine racemase